MSGSQPFVADIQELRRRAREHLEEGTRVDDGETALKLLNDALATGIVRVRRYTAHCLSARGPHRDVVKQEFGPHARQEQEHALRLAERIQQLGGCPDFTPEGLRSLDTRPPYDVQDRWDWIREELAAADLVLQTYRELIPSFADRDPLTRQLLEDLVSREEAHARDLEARLRSSEPRPGSAPSGPAPDPTGSIAGRPRRPSA
ncbi:ferritin-like domain-containing protein [Corallococcus llansteffanensis]|uniref:Bacterioferritin n=1 Tax=Corallococcus llansteffanensis TaxID=2316731 RepID=A0A3A8Q153_9BACT|nr:ferritin-like domain-containing protein [Corallococcus llansteffanensis]RKH62489.1 bacterioferritin [Corallococcus llansteffanensis]